MARPDLGENEPDETPAPPSRPLRSGFTTGTAATVAAVAAARMLNGEPRPERLSVRLPGGADLAASVAEGRRLGPEAAVAVVIKDAGDDPDVTNQAEIGAVVRRRREPGLFLTGGRGVGRVTKPGLAVRPGEWAINPGPRAMLAENLAPFLLSGGLDVEIFVPRGEELAALTLNPRLGIVGGLSILGSTGLVKPFSHEAYLGAVDSALSLARALGLEKIVLSTGRRSEALAQAARPDWPEEAFIQIADYFGDSLKMAAARGFKTIHTAAFFGKALKQAAGLANTHARRQEQDPGLLAAWLAGAVSPRVLVRVREALTARAALEILEEDGAAPLAAKLTAEKALAAARAFAGPGPDEMELTVFDYEGRPLAVAGDLAGVTTQA